MKPDLCLITLTKQRTHALKIKTPRRVLRNDSAHHREVNIWGEQINQAISFLFFFFWGTIYLEYEKEKIMFNADISRLTDTLQAALQKLEAVKRDR